MKFKYIILISLTLVFLGLALVAALKDWENAYFPLFILAAAATGLTAMVQWHARKFGYICPECHQPFIISAWRDFITPHMGEVKRLRCPRCHKTNWCKAVPRDEEFLEKFLSKSSFQGGSKPPTTLMK